MMRDNKQKTYAWNWYHSNFILSGLLVFFILNPLSVWAQETKKADRKAERLHAEAQRDTKKGEFYQAEAKYRKSISGNPDKMDSRYNLGSAYYDKEQYKESLMRFEEAAKLANNKDQKHAAYHNLGNALMKDKQYRNAEQAFKEALRNNPTDEETRYNYALAKELAKDEPEPPSEDNAPDDDQEEDQDNQDDQDPEQEDGEDEEEQGEEEEQDGEPEDEDGEGEKDQQEVPQDGKLSPEQIQNLLDAMENAEKDVQKKLEEQKEKGKELNKEKYW